MVGLLEFNNSDQDVLPEIIKGAGQQVMLGYVRRDVQETVVKDGVYIVEV